MSTPLGRNYNCRLPETKRQAFVLGGTIIYPERERERERSYNKTSKYMIIVTILYGQFFIGNMYVHMVCSRWKVHGGVVFFWFVTKWPAPGTVQSNILLITLKVSCGDMYGGEGFSLTRCILICRGFILNKIMIQCCAVYGN